MKLVPILVLACLLIGSHAVHYHARLRHHARQGHRASPIPAGLENFITTPQKECQKVEKEKVETVDITFRTYHPTSFDFWDVKISDGPVSNFLDALDGAFEQPIRDGFQSSFDFFLSQPSTSGTEEASHVTTEEGVSINQSVSSQTNAAMGLNDPAMMSTTAVSLPQLINGAQAALWPLSKDFKTVLETHDKNGDGMLQFKEFCWLLIDLWSGADALTTSECTNCLKEVRDDLEKLFWFIDCDGSGAITSEEIYTSMKDFDTKGVPLDSTSTNDFVLKADGNWNAKINLNEFTRGVLLQYWDRMVGDDGFNDDYKAMKEIRAANRANVARGGV